MTEPGLDLVVELSPETLPMMLDPEAMDDVVTNLIQQAPDFQKDGKFDMQTYREVLAVNGYVPSEFERAQRINLRRNQLERAIIDSAVLTQPA